MIDIPAPRRTPARRRTRAHRRTPARRTVLGLVVVLGAALAAGIGAGALIRSDSRTPIVSAARASALNGQASWASGVRLAPAITQLRDQSGRPFSLSGLHGHTVAIVFFDSHCTQECPLEGRALAAAERAVPRADRPVLVAVSVNPRDTVASVRHAVRAWGLASVAPWHWLMASRARLAPVWRAYRIFVGRERDGDVPHTEALYLVGRSGYERSAYLFPFVPRFVAHDIRSIARSGPRPTR